VCNRELCSLYSLAYINRVINTRNELDTGLNAGNKKLVPTVRSSNTDQYRFVVFEGS
jgi:hypothetical protein